ncbi:MAG: polyprenyl synthetase family protein [Candidatus Nealsonbacteria bacterium]
MQFSQTLSSLQKTINQEIERFFKLRINQADSSFEKKVLAWLLEYSLRKAKRLRAILVYSGYLLAGGKNKGAILKTAIFIELIHNYLLLHDDILDQDDLRRGKTSFHRLHGINEAIVAGDQICALGYDILVSAPFSEKAKILSLEKLNKTLYNTCSGQLLEFDFKNKSKSGKKIKDRELLEVYKKKTAFYTLVAPLQIGALLTGAKEPFLKKIEKFALPLGIAFQIRDDLIDGDIERTFGLNKEKYKTMQVKLINQSKSILKSEKSFSAREKDFLLNLADYCKFND